MICDLIPADYLRQFERLILRELRGADEPELPLRVFAEVGRVELRRVLVRLFAELTHQLPHLQLWPEAN